MPQLIGTVVVIVYTAVVSYLILKLVDKVVGLRVSREEEIQGLDISLHGEKAYGER